MVDDYSASTSTTGAVAVGGSATGDLETGYDRDWFAVTLEAGKTYRIDLEGRLTGLGTLGDPYLRGVYDADGNLISGTLNDNGGESYNSRVTFTAGANGVYYVAAGAKSNDYSGTYTVSVIDVTDGAPDDFAADTGTTGTVAVGGSAAGKIESGDDRDWFAVTLEAGKTYRIDLEGSLTGAGTLRHPYIGGIHDSGGGLIAGTTNSVGGVLVFTADANAVYYVAAGAFRGREGTYKLSVTDITDSITDDFAAGTGTSGAVSVRGSATGKIDTNGDRDWFAVTLEADRTYQIDLKGWSTDDGTLPDPYLRGVYDADGVLLGGTTNDSGGVGWNSRVVFTPDAAGTYYVAAGAWGDWQGTYRVSVTDVTESMDDFAAGTGTTGAVSVGGSEPGEIEVAGDRDWFAVTLEAGRTYRIDLEGRPTEAGTLWNAYLRGVYDSGGDLITGTTNNNGGAGFNSRVVFTPTAAGKYYVAAGASGDQDGTYKLSVTDVTDSITDDFAAGTGTKGMVWLGGSEPGEIGHAGDQDWFAVTLEAGKIYRIDLKGAWSWDHHALRDPYLYGVYDADGNLIPGTTDDDGGELYNSRVLFKPDAAGTYYVAAGVNRSDAWGHGAYKLAVTDITDGSWDDFAAGTGTTGAVSVGGSATGEIEVWDDRDWFAVTLEAGITYRIELKGWLTSHGTLRDPYLRGVYDAEGNLIPGTTNDDGGKGDNSLLDFTPDADGTYYVAAGANRFDSRGHGTYTLSVTEVLASKNQVSEEADFTADMATAGAVAVGGAATGEVGTGDDQGWHAVKLEAGTAYRIDLEGSQTDAGTLRDPYLLGVYDAEGNLVPGTWDDDGGQSLNSRVAFTPDEAGTYYISAGAAGSGSGTYTLSVTEEPVAEEPADLAADATTAGAVAVGGSATGEIERDGDRDWFAVTLEAGKAYRFEVRGSGAGAGTLGSPNLEGVYDAAGNLVPGTSDNYGGLVEDYAHTFFRPETGGTYYIEAGGSFANSLGTYTVSVVEASLDDYPADTTTTGVVAVGGSVTGELWPTPDQDWYAVTLTAGTAYRIDLEGRDTGGGTLRDPILRGVYDADGNLIPGTTNYDSGEGHNSRLEFTPDADGTYYISIGAWNLLLANHYFFGNGTYRLSVTEVGASEPPASEAPDDLADDAATAVAVAVGGSATGEVETAGDRDWFAVTLEAGRTYRIDLEGYQTGRGTLADPYLRGVYDAHGNLISDTPNDDGGEGSNSRMVFTPHEDAVYFVAAGTSGDHVGTFTLSVIDESAAGAPADVAADTTTAHAVAVGGSAAGALETAHDRDWYAVKLEAGTSYRIDIEGWETGGGTLHNPYLRGVYDPDGNLVPGTTDDDGGERYNSRVTFTPDASGTYYISAGAYLSWFGTYKLSVTEAPAVEAPVAAPPVNEAPDDLAADTATAGAVAVGGSVAGEIETAGDRDWFAVTLEAGKTYRIDLEGWETDAVMFPDPYLRGVYDAEGNLVPGTLDDNGGVFLNSRLAFTPDADGTYYISAGAAGSGSGAYTVSVTEEPAPEAPDDFTDDTGTAGAVAVGGSAAGEIETAGDRDWFAVTLEAGTAYRIDLEGWATGLATGWAIDGGTLADPYLRGVYDAEGNLVPGTLDDDDGVFLNSRVAFTPDASGTYYISAGARGSHVGTYTLLVTEEPAVEAPADLAADTTTAGAVAVGGSVAGEVETAGDRDWYAVTLEAGTAYRIDLEGSPTHGGTLSDPYLRGVYDADGNLVPGTPDDNGGQALNSRLAFTPDEAGTYYIEAGAWSTVVGTYTLSVEEGL